RCCTSATDWLLLTARGTQAILSSRPARGPCGKDRTTAGDLGPADSEDPDPRSESRLGDLQSYPTDFSRRAEREPGLSVSSSAPSRVAGGCHVRDDGLGKQSTRACLHADARGPPPSGDGERHLGTIHAVDEAGSERPMK